MTYNPNPNGQANMANSAPVVIASDQTPIASYLSTKLDNVNDSVTTFPFGHSYFNLATHATTTVKSGSGVLHAVYINTKGRDGNSVTLYDSTTAGGNKLGTIDTTGAQGAFLQDIAFASGLTIVATGGVPADVTVVYR